MTPDKWVSTVQARVKQFAMQHSMVLSQTKRQVSASFEIGCFHALTEFYEDGFQVTPANLTSAGEYRYLTTPNGNPHNFSYIRLKGQAGEYELRQQVRIRSHVHSDIAMTPDLAIVVADAQVHASKREDYASGKRGFYLVDSSDVVAAHECKSMNPFPELLVSFLGTLFSCHAWLDDSSPAFVPDADGVHLAPSLFIGGDASALHRKMISALEQAYEMNVIVGLHAGKWNLLGASRELNRLSPTLSTTSASSGRQQRDTQSSV